MIWSTSDAELELDFEDAAKDFTVNGNDIALNFKIHLDAIMAKLITLANQNLLVDRDGDGIIEISTGNDDGHQDIGSKRFTRK
jgi:hypothetical protein